MKNPKSKQFVITLRWLNDNGACEEGKTWFLKQKSKSLSVVINRLIKERHFNWANWTLVRFMDNRQQVRYACFSALQKISSFEKLYPNDKRPRQAIEAALKWAEDPSDVNRSAARSAESAWAAAWAAESAARSARSAWAAAESAARSAWAAAWAAKSAAWAAESAARSAARSAESAWAAAESAKSAAESAKSAAWAAAESAKSAAESAWKNILLEGIKILSRG